MQEYREASQIDPAWITKANETAQELTLEQDPQRRNLREAERLARQVCQATSDQRPEFLQTLAACFAAEGQYGEAITAAKKALKVASTQTQSQLVHLLESSLRTYESHQAATEFPE
jgi:hypothetical protein